MTGLGPGPDPVDPEARSPLLTVVKSRLVVASLVLLVSGGLLLALSVRVASATVQLILNNLAAVLIGSGVVSMVYEYYMRMDFTDFMRSESERILHRLFPVLSRLNSVGVLNAYKNRSEIPWDELLQSASKEVSVFNTTPSFWGAVANIDDLLKRALDNGAQVRFAVLDPDCEFAIERGEDIGYSQTASFANEIRAGADLLTSFTQQYPERFELHKVTAMPTCVYVRIDQKIFLNFFLARSRSRSHLHFELDAAAASAKPYIEHFRSLWERSKPYAASKSEATYNALQPTP